MMKIKCDKTVKPKYHLLLEENEIVTLVSQADGEAVINNS